MARFLLIKLTLVGMLLSVAGTALASGAGHGHGTTGTTIQLRAQHEDDALSAMRMVQLMMQCVRMFERAGETPDARDMMPVHYDEATATALARAFLAGYAPGAEVTEIDFIASYRVHFQDDEAEGTLLIDAETGEVSLLSGSR